MTCVAILPGNQIVSGSIDSTVKVWNNAGVSRSFVGHKGPVTSVSVLRDGRVVSASIDRTIKVWNMVDRSSITLRGHSSTVRSVSVLWMVELCLLLMTLHYVYGHCLPWRVV